MKKVFIILTSFTITIGCVSNSKGIPVDIQVISDDFSIEENLAKSSISNFITPKLLECSEPIKLQPQVTINRFSGKEAEELKIEFKKNFFQNLFEANIDEEKGRKLLEDYEIPKEWKTNNYQNSKNEIITYLRNLDEDVILLADKEYDSIPNLTNPIIFKNAEEYKSLLAQLYCENGNRPNKIVILYNLKSFHDNKIEYGTEETEEEIQSGSDEIKGDPCTQNTVTDGLDLKEDLMQIIDTKRSYKERDRLARETWKKYFDSMASVTFYVKANQKYPEGFFESGDGANYFIDRLAYMSSITNVNITRIEYHKDTQKISGIVIVECHNASEIQ